MWGSASPWICTKQHAACVAFSSGVSLKSKRYNHTEVLTWLLLRRITVLFYQRSDFHKYSLKYLIFCFFFPDYSRITSLVITKVFHQEYLLEVDCAHLDYTGLLWLFFFRLTMFLFFVVLCFVVLFVCLFFGGGFGGFFWGGVLFFLQKLLQTLILLSM